MMQLIQYIRRIQRKSYFKNLLNYEMIYYKENLIEPHNGYKEQG
jgi:hypothetical protein